MTWKNFVCMQVTFEISWRNVNQWLTKTTRMTWKKSPYTLMYKLCSNFCSAVHVYMYICIMYYFFTFCVDFVPCNTIKHILWRRTNCIYFYVDVDWNEDQIIILLLQRRAVLILNLSYDKAYFLFFEAFLGRFTALDPLCTLFLLIAVLSFNVYYRIVC